MKKIDNIKINKKLAREEAISSGTNLVSFHRVHKNKKAYKRVNVKELIKNDY